jgi:2-methylcitrate dehydratase PrpD
VTKQLASWAASVSFDDLPPAVVEKARQGLLDTLGVGLAGARHEASRRMAATVAELAGQPQSTLLGTGERSSMSLAAMANAYFAHVLDFDDTHFDAIVHVNAPVVAASLAVGEHRRARGAEVLAAHVVGLEVTSRVAVLAGRQPKHGWHLTGTCGAFGAAAAAGRLLHLDTERMVHAIGIASTMASGLRGHRGTMTKALNPANAAGNGVVAAVAAGRDMTASPRIMEDPELGFFVAHGGPFDPAVAVDLGTRYRMLDWDPKPYPCGVVIHPAVDAVLDLYARGVRARDVAAVELRVNPLALTITGNRQPQDGLQAKFSVFHAAATALLTGSLLPRHFEDAWARDDRVVDLRSRVSGHAVEGLPRDEATVVCRMRDGSTLDATAKARGTRRRRMTGSEVQQKFCLLAEPLLGAERTKEVTDMVSGIDGIDNVGDLVTLCAAGPA